ncbi:MAG: DUF3788 domain-containing protein [Promethearchaeota archaeon]
MIKPEIEEILSYIGKARTLWREIENYLNDNYDFVQETVFYGKKYGWTVRYRKSGRTLCSLFPEKGAFTILITLSKKEAEKTLSMKNELSPKIYNLIRDSKQLRDGRWLWIRIFETNDILDVKKIVAVKRKPKKL